MNGLKDSVGNHLSGPALRWDECSKNNESSFVLPIVRLASPVNCLALPLRLGLKE